MFNTINSKLILAIGFVTVLIISIFSYFLQENQYQHLINEVRRGVSTLSDTVTRSTRYDMLHNNREAINRMIGNIGEQKGIEMVRIFNKEGKIMFSNKKGEISKDVDKNAEACYICHVKEEPLTRLTTKERSRIFQSKDHRILAMINSIYNEPDCYNADCHVHSKEQIVLGVLDIGVSLRDIDTDLKRNRILIIIFTLMAILFISSILTYLIQRLVTRPVRNLVDATKQVARGDLNIKLPARTNDEISLLATSFNRMIIDLDKANEEIKIWNLVLEKRVKERTEKLKIAKEQLLQSEKMASLGVLASSIAHEINNPLQGIFTYIKLMSKIISKNNDDKLLRFE
jgi:two-component system NtrC family sensor kinase